MAASGGAHLKAGNHGSSYASKVTGIKSKGRKKLNVLDILLERRENAINYNLSKEELAKLLFVKMAIDPKKVKKIDTAGFGKILIELTENLRDSLTVHHLISGRGLGPSITDPITGKTLW